MYIQEKKPTVANKKAQMFKRSNVPKKKTKSAKAQKRQARKKERFKVRFKFE